MKHIRVKSNKKKKSPGFKIHCSIDWIFYTHTGTHFLPPTPHSVFWHFLTAVRLNIPSHVRICAIITYPPYQTACSVTTEHVTYNNELFSSMSQQPQWAMASSLSKLHDHTVTLHSARLLWTRDQTSTRQHTTLTTDRHPCTRRNSKPQSQQASRLRPTL
jgi:hypothetical protein